MAMKFPQFITTSNGTTNVVGMIDYDLIIDNLKNTEEEDSTDLDDVKKELKKRKIQYIDGKGYVDENEYIWIFNAKGKPKNPNAYPYFWINEDGEKEFSNPPELIKDEYTVDNMMDLSLVETIKNTEPNEVHYDEEMLNDINASSSSFTPTVKLDDDFLKKIVKWLILVMGVDINALKSKTFEKYVLPNMKSALQNKTKMSVIYFITWMNLLGCDFEITVVSNGEDGKNTLKFPLVYRSYTDSVGLLKDGKIEELSKAALLLEEDEDE